ncbi:hypothetical protein L1887_29671 [Cichorium endivia]|nr:hypothetical protein L1887_29671 [Cichorium endivia]
MSVRDSRISNKKLLTIKKLTFNSVVCVTLYTIYIKIVVNRTWPFELLPFSALSQLFFFTSHMIYSEKGVTEDDERK